MADKKAQANSGQPLPRWLQTLLSVQALMLWGFLVFLVWIMPEKWETVLGMPFPLARVFTSLAASTLTLLATASWLFPASRLLGWGFGLLQGLAGSWLSPPSIVFCLAVAVRLNVNEWLGHKLLSGLFILFALTIYLANPKIDTATHKKRFLLAVPAAMIAVGLGLRLWWLLADFVWTDEGFHLSAAAGMLAGKNIAPANMFFPQDMIIPPWRGFAFGIYAPWARVFGLGLIQARSLAYLFGLAALPFVYAGVRMWYGRSSALFSTSFVALSLLFMHSTIGRSDSLPMLAVSITMWAHILACRRNKPLLHALVGLLAVLSLETHFAVLPFLVTWGGYYALDYLVQAWRERRLFRPAPLWFFLAGAIPALALYYVVHVHLLPNPQGVADTANIFIPSGNLVLWRLRGGLIRLRLFWVTAPIEVLLVAAAAVVALIRRTAADKHWLALMLFTVLGYIALGTDPQIQHTTYGLPILLGSSGALFAYGIRKEERAASLLNRLAYAGAAILLILPAFRTIYLHGKDRVHWEAVNGPIITYVRENVPTDAAIITPPVFIPYLIGDYQTFLHNYAPGVARGPALAGVATDMYWQDILLQTWPVARIEAYQYPNKELQIQIDYMSARHATEVVPHLWIVHDGDLITDADYTQTTTQAALQMVGHVRWVDPFEPGDTLKLDTLWINREPLATGTSVTLMLLDSHGEPIAQARQQMLSGWAGTPTSQWDRVSFHDVAFTLALPAGLPSGTYTLALSLEGEACRPLCNFTVDTLAVRP